MLCSLYSHSSRFMSWKCLFLIMGKIKISLLWSIFLLFTCHAKRCGDISQIELFSLTLKNKQIILHELLNIKYELYAFITHIISLKFKKYDMFLYKFRLSIWFERCLQVFFLFAIPKSFPHLPELPCAGLCRTPGRWRW